MIPLFDLLNHNPAARLDWLCLPSPAETSHADADADAHAPAHPASASASASGSSAIATTQSGTPARMLQFRWNSTHATDAEVNPAHCPCGQSSAIAPKGAVLDSSQSSARLAQISVWLAGDALTSHTSILARARAANCDI